MALALERIPRSRKQAWVQAAGAGGQSTSRRFLSAQDGQQIEPGSVDVADALGQFAEAYATVGLEHGNTFTGRTAKGQCAAGEHAGI